MIYPTFRKQGRYAVSVMLSEAETSLCIARRNCLQSSETLRQAQGDKQMKNEERRVKNEE